MKSLENIPWQKLIGPYGINEELPLNIQKLQKVYSKKLLDEIVWDSIYHQGTLYQNTFATIPYLIEIAETINEWEAKLEIFIDVLLVETVNKNSRRVDILPIEFNKDLAISEAQAKEIYADYIQSLDRLPKMIPNLISYIKTSTKNDIEKTYFLAAIAAAYDQKNIGKIFSTFAEGDEYVCLCSNCKNEHLIWPNNQTLVAYKGNPTFNDTLIPILIQPKTISSIWNGKIEGSNKIDWLSHYINELNIESLKWKIPYLFGTYNCPNCTNKIFVFEGIENSV